jgi:hypothetical protein
MPAVEHLGKAGMVGNFRDLDAAVAKQLGSATGRQDCDAKTGERTGEFHDPGLVGNANQRSLDDGHDIG